ncbi:LpqN/LpqT family lipoprotein [uncultured Cellulomonas sp.]|uniref:LpqN/LpqT family lipoprotein n=1 Tax=uncultured Cellulomonas sp. TaxID=189682 RepID=UPI00261CE467|nr:LpqN/LpqT family lipoprotein [uncultured Cellulomonas sp.]
MTGTARFPSEAFPAFPSIELDHPGAWVPLVAPGVVLAVAKRVPPRSFQPLVGVSVTRFGPGRTLADAIEAVLASIAPLSGYAELGRAELDVLGLPGFRIEGAFEHPQLGGLVQAARLTVVDHGAAVDVVQLTGTCTAKQLRGTLDEIRAIQAGARLA